MPQQTEESTAGTTATTPSLPPLRIATSVPLPPARAFDLFTRDIASWWPLATYSVAGDRAATCRFEGVTGSALVEEAADGTRHVWGTVLAWEPPDRVAFTWHPGREAASALEVEVRFTAEPAGCRVELTHSGWEALGETAEETRERYQGGWQHVLGTAFRQAAQARGRIA